MTNYLSRQWRSLSRRWWRACFWLSRRNRRVKVEGRLKLTVPLICDGMGEVLIGPRVAFGYGLSASLGDGAIRLQARTYDSRISIGQGTQLSNNVQIFSEKSISIGQSCLIGDAVLIIDSDFHNLSPEGRYSHPADSKPVVLEDNVFIGSRAIILKGVTIGKDSVIGAGSVGC